MSDDDDPGEVGGELTTWKAARDRNMRFAANLFNLERTMDRLVRNQGAQQKLLNDLDDRVRRIETQQEIIIRLSGTRPPGLIDHESIASAPDFRWRFETACTRRCGAAA